MPWQLAVALDVHRRESLDAVVAADNVVCQVGAAEGFAGHESEARPDRRRGRLVPRKAYNRRRKVRRPQGIAGKTLQEIEGLDIKVLPATQEP